VLCCVVINPCVVAGGSVVYIPWTGLQPLQINSPTSWQAAGAIIIEVRRQFAEIPGLREGTAHADSDRCVAISTQSAVQEMVLPGTCAILTPIIVGFLVGPRCLTGVLGGSIASGMMLALMMANAGGAWDNAKKYIEIENAKGGKGTETHKAWYVLSLPYLLCRLCIVL
jgi:K(+)-stimulated pyrophosphate-energized sodium pump